MIRSRAQMIQGNVRSTQQFLSQLNRADKLIKKSTVDKVTINSKEEIVTACHNYYENLLTAEPTDTDLFKYLTQNLLKLKIPN